MDCGVFLRLVVIHLSLLVAPTVQQSNDTEFAGVFPDHIYFGYSPDVATAQIPLFWNKSRETGEEFHNRVCHHRCHGPSGSDSPADSEECLRCFPCTCEPYCDREGTCCPQEGQDWVPPATERSQCLVDFDEMSARVLSVVKCHPDFPAENDERELCESKTLPRRRDTVLPVTSNSSFVTYTNMHCAACNHDNEDLAEWGVRCLHNQYLYDAMNDTDYDERAIQLPDLCGFTRNPLVRPADYHSCSDLSLFSGHAVSTCNVTGQWAVKDEDVRKACEESDSPRGAAVLIKNGGLYANAFCVMCNEDEESLLEHCLISGSPGFRVPDIIRTSTGLMFDTVVLTAIRTRPRSDCSEGYWPHPEGECRELQCAAGKTLEGGVCSTAVRRVRGLGYHLRILLKPIVLGFTRVSNPTNPPQSVHSDTCYYGQALWAAMEAKIGFTFVDRAGNITTAAAVNETCFTEAYQKQLERLINHVNATSNAEGGMTGLELNVEDIASEEARFLAAEVEAYVLSKPTVQREHAENLLASLFEKEWSVTLGEWTVRLKAFDVSTRLLRGGDEKSDLAVDGVSDVDKTMFPYEKNMSPLIGLEHLFLPFTGELRCPHLRFQPDEFTVVTCDDCDTQVKFPCFMDPDDKPVSFLARSYPQGAWLTGDGQLAMCMDTFSEVFPQNVTVIKPSQRQTSMVRQVMSAVCGSVSVVCLAVTFVTYALFRQLRALPGLNNMGLSLSLATAQLSLLLPWHLTGVVWVCRAVGVLTHWAWLTALGWMGVCCTHMVRVFTSKTHHSLSERGVKKAFLQHVLATSLISTLIVGLTVVVSSALSRGVSMGYGGPLCFLDTELHPLLLLAVWVPLGLVVITNLSCFALTVVAIVRVRRLQARAPRERRDVLVYAKLVTVTGGAWVLGFLAELTDQEWMRVVAELCIAAQGLLLFLAYVCNTRVWRLYRARFGTAPPSNATSTSSPATALTTANTAKSSEAEA
ncbi:uncharacterized protein [Littorina saxatilis]|uniref:G-protein coupled receptors family 2 profile 2 domain-containing protein n=1 Tax=Littorina saxatilis TaxID=31220 RepID=A0AAN9GHB5_9CAEN